MKNQKRISWGGLAALCVVSLLGACRGGSGAVTTSSSLVVVDPVPVVNASSIVNGALPTSTYTVGSQELSAFKDGLNNSLQSDVAADYNSLQSDVTVD